MRAAKASARLGRAHVEEVNLAAVLRVGLVVRLSRALIVIVPVVMLAACGSSGPATASSLVAQIPHCGSLPLAQAPGPEMTSQAECGLPDGAQVYIALFTSESAENAWIASQGIYYGCCVQGDGWAATVDNSSQGGPQPADWQAVLAHAGGRQVSNPP
jgi:hypothetical protein